MIIVVIVILIIAIIILIVLLFMYKKEMQHISKQLATINANKTEKIIDVSFVDRDIVTLAAQINENIAFQKRQRVDVIKREQQLKESITNISHDLRTPLTSIIGYIQLMNKEKLTEKQKDYMTAVLEKSIDLRELIDTFFELSALQLNDRLPTFQRINLGNFVSNFIMDNVELFEKEAIVPSINILSHYIFVMVDIFMLNRIMQNLVSNSLRYGTGDIAFTVSETNGGCLSISNSIINSEDINIGYLFDKFYMADTSRNNGGTGLGLAIVKTLVDNMHGTVEASLTKYTLEISITFLCVK